VSKVIVGLFTGLLLGAAIAWTIATRKAGAAKEVVKEEEHAEKSHVVHTNGRTFLRLEQEAQTRAGLKLAPLKATSLKPDVKGFGRVLDPTPLAALIMESATARTALDASTKELQRLKVLSQDQNASARALETAAAAAQRDQIAVQAVELKLLTTWGQAIASQPDLPGFVRNLVSQQAALVRIDVPLDQTLSQPPARARIAPLTAEDQTLDAEFLGPAANTDVLNQGRGFLFVLRKQHLPLDTAVIGWLPVPGEPQNGVVVPRSAIVRHEGETFVYLQSRDDLFERVPVELEHPIENGWFVQQKLTADQKIVVLGAQQLLSQELNGGGAE
jgi:hypothetical protein